MKIIAFIAFLLLALCPIAKADICYGISEQVAAKATDIVQTQKEIYQYCSICPEDRPHVLEVQNIQTGNPLKVNDVALDLAHTYYKQNNKFINLGVASGCIKAREYDIPAELENLDAHANKKHESQTLKQEFIECSNTFEIEENKCSKLSSIRCYEHLMQAHKNVQQCYKKVATDLFNNYYDLSKADAEKKFDSYRKFIYEQYFFIFSETNHCQKNNCGVSMYLYSEYATTQALYDYISKMIKAVSS